MKKSCRSQTGHESSVFRQVFPHLQLHDKDLRENNKTLQQQYALIIFKLYNECPF
jgi:hypothetical protein